ncbi:hypothetical protein DM860_015847 [Cuscuta australis]|uniref:Uncharacterized protein n=1 Tax=Cuscuta australis TaxID=267555 RepID=A0A328DZR4_9ASTE|nr:hypothetical protein DM860_015847 [Cuscuta australis]
MPFQSRNLVQVALPFGKRKYNYRLTAFIDTAALSRKQPKAESMSEEAEPVKSGSVGAEHVQTNILKTLIGMSLAMIYMQFPIPCHFIPALLSTRPHLLVKLMKKARLKI